MELKTYQKKVMADLERFLTLLTEKQNIKLAYNTLWEEKGVEVSALDLPGTMPCYKTTLPGVPQVCLKVPTGGGKTFLAANAIKPIFDSMPGKHPKAVVWLVPSDAILKQTINTLQDSTHFYRQKIDLDFSGAVEVYGKEQLMTGQKFNPTEVMEHLSVFVLSYDSFRTSKKEGRKAYQENGNLVSFSKYRIDKADLLEGTDETALIQVIRQLNPVVIVDESHHATSTLSIEMLRNFNPSFVLDLTATPKQGSNIISFVDARQLKKEEMVKLPVIVYNRRSQGDVLLTAIGLRKRLENEAKRLEDMGGKYIRPIVLFQAEANTNDNSTTYEKIKRELVEMGIPEEEIAIKTADKDDIKNQDLMSRDCPFRYIITVNALKEGWDCPFAYILATIANRSSVVDVEQIIGRILRLPNTKKNESAVLNLSYVITSSADFFATCNKVVDGLKVAGFSDKDYRAEDDSSMAGQESTLQTEPEQMTFATEETEIRTEHEDGQALSTEEPIFYTDELKEQVIRALCEDTVSEADHKDAVLGISAELDGIFQTAKKEESACWEDIAAEDKDSVADVPPEVRDAMKTYPIKAEFWEEALALRLPQFALLDAPSLFSTEEYSLLQKENLYVGFTLLDKDTKIDFSMLDVEMAQVDVEEGENSSPKAWRLQGFESAYMKEWFDAQPSERKRRICKERIIKRISKINAVNDAELDEYVSRVMQNMTEDQLTDLEQSDYLYIQKIYDKVRQLLAAHAKDTFEKWIEQDMISCQPLYSFPISITAAKVNDAIPKSLYTAEEDVNGYESRVAWELSALPNIRWWHRNISRSGFAINGAVTAYPDLIAMTEKGKVLLVETKGDYLKNDESKEKAEIGATWAAKASQLGRIYKYFMVYETKKPEYAGAYSHERFMEIVREL
ncbi:MAG: DEAD/DEAH box helicase family protein [Muribaculum sp.]|nr:DEAD/DEAH box helicase family protein [Muribaculum sp.]